MMITDDDLFQAFINFISYHLDHDPVPPLPWDVKDPSARDGTDGGEGRLKE